ncbi:MAG TPA: hypothetical protein VLD37_01895 [Candidatus Bilamarchaeum sp.]|nr:hypothetical protein [Candidatus Bilamarchaeum sp.]
MRIVAVLLIVAALVLAGCGSPAPPAKGGSPPANQSPPAQQPPSGGTTSPPPTTAPPAQNNTSGTTTQPPPPSGGTATQADCATMTPNCGACIEKAGCGWCKTSNGCYRGDASGPAGDIQCQPADWAVTSQACEAPSSPVGSTCAEQYNCAHCLTGSGCKWCIDGSRCVDSSNTDVCPNGLGWLTQSYQCNLASR